MRRLTQPGRGRDAIAPLLDLHVDDALRPFLVGAGKHAFVPEGLEGGVAYGMAASVVVALGDPIGPDGWLAFDCLIQRVHRWSRQIAVYQATDGGAEALGRRGFTAIPVGREAVVDLRGFDLEGPRRANLRHTIARSRRGGLSAAWYSCGLGPDSDAVLAQMSSVDRRWRRAAGPQMTFTISRFEPDDARDGPTAVTYDADHRPVAFATFRRSGGTSFVLDVMRRVADAPPGALEWCIAEAALGLRRDGATTLSLGLAPLAGLNRTSGQPQERLLALAADAVRPAYDVDGLTFFKGKFDPEWRTRYLAIESPAALPRVASALLRLHLADASEPPLRATRRIGAGFATAISEQVSAAIRANLPVLRAEALRRAGVCLPSMAAAWFGGRFGARAGRRTAAATAVAGAAMVAAVGMGARRSRRLLQGVPPASPRSSAPRITVLVAARNEEAVLPDLIRDLAAQDDRDDQGRPMFDVLVVADRCTDQTLHRSLQAARNAGIADAVSFRPRKGRDLAPGKGAALAWVPLDDCGEIIVVLDADACLEPGLLSAVRRRAASGLSAFAIRRRIEVADGGWLAQAQADEQALDAAVESARFAHGGRPQFRGNGMVIEREVLRAAGGWTVALTEDLDLSARLAALTNARVAWPEEPQVGEQAVRDARGLWRQRMRWAEGALRSTAAWTMPALASSSSTARGRIDRAGYAVQLLAPFVVLGSLAGGVRRRRLAGAAVLAGGIASVVFATTFDAIRSAAPPPVSTRSRLGRSVRATALVGLWMGAVPLAAVRIVLGPRTWRYDQTGHVRRPGAVAEPPAIEAAARRGAG